MKTETALKTPMTSAQEIFLLGIQKCSMIGTEMVALTASTTLMMTMMVFWI